MPNDWTAGDFDAANMVWRPGSGKNVRWVASLGTSGYATPAVARGKVFIGANSAAGRLGRFPATIDLGCLLCLDERKGQFLWQYSSPKLPTGFANDWPSIGICSTPLVEEDRLWLVTNRCEVVCLDAEGFFDNQNDGLVREIEWPGEADVVWKLDMYNQLGVRPHNMSNCSLTSAGPFLFVCTFQIVAPRRLQALKEAEGEVAIANPNSGAVWQYAEFDSDGDGKIAHFEERMHRTWGTAAIKNDLLFLPDFSGLVHCVDAKFKFRSFC